MVSILLAAVPSLDTQRLDGPVHRAIVAVDIEGSATRTYNDRGEIRRITYSLLERALNTSRIDSQHREQFADRGDGVLILIRPHDEVPKTLLLGSLIPALTKLLTEHNAGVFRPELRLRLRVAVHAGEIHWDDHGFYGDDLDVAFRLLDAQRVKKALRDAPESPLALVVSEEIFNAIVRQGHLGQDPYEQLVRVQVGGRRRHGRIHIPSLAGPGRPAAGLYLKSQRPPEPVTPAEDPRPLTLAGVYRAAEQRLAETEDPHDVEAGLAGLKKWMQPIAPARAGNSGGDLCRER